MYGFYSLGIFTLVEALNNPHNRHETRVKYSCDDNELHNHPEWLVSTYLDRRNPDVIKQTSQVASQSRG